MREGGVGGGCLPEFTPEEKEMLKGWADFSDKQLHQDTEWRLAHLSARAVPAVQTFLAGRGGMKTSAAWR